MAKFNVMVLIQGRPVMGDKVEAPTPAEARAQIEARFWSGPDDLRAAIPKMDAMNFKSASALLPLMEKTLADARSFGISVEARKSRAA